MRSRRATNTEATRAAILREARRTFARHGYEAASLSDVAARARVTTGALYHHFAGKAALFQAVAEGLEEELLARSASVSASDPWLRLELGFEVLLDACATQEVQQILFLDAPRIIGLAAWREIELRYAYGALRAVLQSLQSQGRLGDYPIDLLAPILLAFLRETSQILATASDQQKVRTQARALLSRILSAIKAD